jgi:predicted transcriptional regulator
MTLSDIKNSLDPSDTNFIARNLGYSPDFVRKVINGERKSTLVVKAAELVVEGKKSLEEQISIMCGEETLDRN